MALIERFTPGGNFYPDGNSTFLVLVDIFRRIAEVRDTRDTAMRGEWAQADQNTLASAAATAQTRANDAKAAAVDAAAQDATTKAAGAETRAKTHADTVAGQTLTDAKSYTDVSFAAAGPGGASDDQVDAAVDRAVLAGRVLGEVTDAAVAGPIGATGSQAQAAVAAQVQARTGTVVRASGDATGATDVANLNAALLQGNVTIRDATFLTNAPVRIPSHRTLTLVDAKIQLVPGSNCNVIQNRNQNSAGDDNIGLILIGQSVITGGNSTTQTSASAYNSAGVTFTNVRGFRLEGGTLGPFRGPCTIFQGATRGRGGNINLAQDRTGPNQDGMDFGPGCRDIQLDGITGVTGDDCFSIFSQKTAGFGHGLYKDPSFTGELSDIQIKNVSVDVGINPIRVQAGDGLKLARVTVENFTNLNQDLSTNNYAVIAFGEASYVTTLPAAGDLSGITLNGYRGRANVIIGAGTHFSKVKMENIIIDSPLKSVIGTAQSNVPFAAAMSDLEVNGLTLTDATTASTASLFNIPTGATLAGFNGDRWSIRRAQTLLNNAGTVTNLDLSRVKIRNLLGQVIASSTAETGYLTDVVVQNTIAGARYSGAATKLVIRGEHPRFRSVDTTPAATKGSTIRCEAGKDPKGGTFANGGEYIGTGSTWVLTSDLGSSF